MSTLEHHEVTILVTLLIIGMTWHIPQNRVSDTTTHVTLNTMNSVVRAHNSRKFAWFWLTFFRSMTIPISLSSKFITQFATSHVFVQPPYWSWVFCNLQSNVLEFSTTSYTCISINCQCDPCIHQSNLNSCQKHTRVSLPLRLFIGKNSYIFYFKIRPEVKENQDYPY